ncbi:MAG: hypothetical protein J6T87_05945 [Bacteroidales bacterium]|nr:hypothetical protein [Bacteroidales bacterium]
MVMSEPCSMVAKPRSVVPSGVWPMVPSEVYRVMTVEMRRMVPTEVYHVILVPPHRMVVVPRSIMTTPHSVAKPYACRLSEAENVAVIALNP